ncbi:MAG: TIGR03084 family protein [Candidatus Rokubacteria bacterium]|nr:TIGR03084 family protein [Candidatus Rokubacteria bacterium]
MSVDHLALCDELAAEHAALDRLVAPLDAGAWSTPTPAPGWTVQDQIGHLAYYDEASALAARAPAEFEAGTARLLQPEREALQLARGRSLASAELLAWWRRARGEMIAGFRAVDRTARLPWYGPSMGAASFITARLEETWAHGQDVADALGVAWTDTDRLRHVAHLGVITRGYSFENQGHRAPRDDVRVELAGASGAVWTWGDASAANRVRGRARDFCLVVTRRRHVADTGLVVEGPVATDWMTIAQAFAGPPGEGRQPGQFRGR